MQYRKYKKIYSFINVGCSFTLSYFQWINKIINQNIPGETTSKYRDDGDGDAIQSYDNLVMVMVVLYSPMITW